MIRRCEICGRPTDVDRLTCGEPACLDAVMLDPTAERRERALAPTPAQRVDDEPSDDEYSGWRGETDE